MTSDACRDARPLLGLAALGQLDPPDALAVRAHLDGCAECRAELDELAGVAAVLPLADVHRMTPPAAPPDELADAVRQRVARERARRRVQRRRVWLASAAAVVAAAAVLAFVVLGPLHSGSARGTTVELSATGGIRATAVLHERAAGTEVAFHASGFVPHQYYWLWLTGSDGDRIAAGTFQGTDGAVDVRLTAALPLDETRRVWVTDAQNRVVADRRIAG